MTQHYTRHRARRWSVLTCAALLAVTGMSTLTSTSAQAAPVTAAAGAAAVAAVAAKPAAKAAATPVTMVQAQVQAAMTGEGVVVTSATTPTQTVTANADGSITVDTTPVPVRKEVAGAWKPLDATLHSNTDGTISPTVATGNLVLSGGGTGTLATISGGGISLALSLPMAMPVPELAGPTATYRNVLAGIDVVLTASLQGDLTEIVVVHDATALALMPTVKFGVETIGMTLTTDAAGNIAGVNAAGLVVMSEPAPRMWDAAAPTGPVTTMPNPLVVGQLLDAATGEPVASSATGPGEGAHTAAMGVAIDGTSLTLTPSAALLAAPGLTYPLYYDPSTNADHYTGWATINQNFPSTKYWDSSPDPNGYMQVGDSGVGGSFVSRSLVKFGIDSVYANVPVADISAAVFKTTEIYSYSCTPSVVNVYAPAANLYATNADWNDWSSVSLGSVVASANVAYGYGTGSCASNSIGFDVRDAVRTSVGAGSTAITFLMKASSETDTNGWKKFAVPTNSNLTLQVTYDHPPATPNNLSTSPTTACTSATLISDGPITLAAAVSDPDRQALGIIFKVWKTSAPGTIIDSTGPANNTVTPPTSTATHIVTAATLESHAGGVSTEFSWSVQTYDSTLYSSVSATCNFQFDPSRPSAVPQPVPVPDPGNPGSATVGSPIDIVIDPPITPPHPTSYSYQLNGGAPATVNARTDGSGIADAVVTPTRATNTITVVGIISGNYGPSTTMSFNAAPPAAPAANDIDGDGDADLLTAGGTNLPSGLWLTSGTGKANPSTVTNSVDIGANGTGNLNGVPADFNGSQVFSGLLSGMGFEDTFVYYPPGSGTQAGTGVLLTGTGTGTVLNTAASGNSTSYSVAALADGNGYSPLQMADIGNTTGMGIGEDDLIAVNGTTGSYYLDYYSNTGYGFYPTQVGNQTPAGDMNWNNWTVTTCLCASTTNPAAMFLWNRTTGALYLWENLSFDGTTLTVGNQYHLSSGWNTGNTTLQVQAADVDGDGIPDLWTTATGGSVVATTVSALTGSGLTGTGTITAQTAVTTVTAAHNWNLSDMTGSAGSAATSTGDVASGTALPATGTGAVWNTGDLFSPDITFNGTNAYLATATNAVVTNTNFSVSAWVNPVGGGGNQAVISQNAATQSGFALRYLGATNQWAMSVATSDASGWNVQTATSPAGSAAPGLWSHVTGVYDSVGGIIKLYVNDILVATATHPKQTGTLTSHGFQIGRDQQNGAATDYFKGQIARVQSWNQTVIPGLAVNPAGYYQTVTPTRILDTRYGTGGITGPIASDATFKINLFASPSPIPAGTPVTSVAITFAVTGSTTAGYLKVYPDDTPAPLASNVNYTPDAGVSASNMVIVPVAADGYIDITNSSSTTAQVFADMAGYFTTNAAASGDSTFTPITTTRYLDTRTTNGGHMSQLTGGTSMNLTIAGAVEGGVTPVPTGITAVVINLSAFNHTSAGYLTAYAAGTTRPSVSNTQFISGDNSNTMAIVPLASGNNQISIYTNITTDLVVDVVGYFSSGTSGMKYHSINATRLIDTRQSSAIAANGTEALPVPGNVLASNPDLITNVTVLSGTQSGWFNAFPDNTTEPSTSSSVVWATNQTSSDLTLGPTTATGTTVDYKNHSSGTVQLIIDCTGYFSAS